MNEAQANAAITLAFTTGWPTLQPLVPFAVQNETGALPKNLPPPGADRFALLTITPTVRVNATVGGVGERLIASSGWIQVKLWVPAGERTDGIKALEQSARDLFEMVFLGSSADGETVDTFASQPQEVPTDGRWFMSIIRTPYRFYELK